MYRAAALYAPAFTNDIQGHSFFKLAGIPSPKYVDIKFVKSCIVRLHFTHQHSFTHTPSSVKGVWASCQSESVCLPIKGKANTSSTKPKKKFSALASEKIVLSCFQMPGKENTQQCFANEYKINGKLRCEEFLVAAIWGFLQTRFLKLIFAFAFM